MRVPRIASAVGVLFGAIAVHAADVEYRGDVTDVAVIRRVEQHPGAALVWHPGLARWKEKHLIAVYGAGIPGKTDMGDIYASVSTNDGGTWSEPSIIFDSRQRHGTLQFAYANPIVFKPEGLDVTWCFAMRCPIAWQHSEDSQLVAAYSGDGGRSWIPVELTMHYSGPAVIVGGLYPVMEQGRTKYLIPVHRNTLRNDPRGSREQFVLESTSLLEWRLPLPPGTRDKPGLFGFVPQPESVPVFLHEGQLAAGEREGEIKMVMRTSKYEKPGEALEPPQAYSSVSRDNGRTWSPAVEEPALHNSVSKPYFWRDQNGTHLYVYNDGPARERKALRYKVKPLVGEWSEERTFFEAGIKNSYPTLIETSPGHYAAVWDSGTDTRNRTTIRFGKFVVKP